MITVKFKFKLELIKQPFAFYLMQTACSLPEDIKLCTLQVVLPQFGVSDVGDVVERPTHNGMVLMLASGGGLLHYSRLRLSLPGPLGKLWRLRDARRKLGTQPERQSRKNISNIIILPLYCITINKVIKV